MRIVVLIILLAITGRSQQGPISCLTAAFTSMKNLIHTIDDVLKDGMWFDKEDIMVTFKSFRDVFEQCSGKIPELFKLQPCVEKVKIVLGNQDFMYYSVLDEEYDKAFQRLTENTEPMIQMMNVCVNSASVLPFNPIPKNAFRVQRLLVK